MDFESKIISRQIGDILYAAVLTIGTAESCTGGRISDASIAIPGSSDYYKGGIVAYTDEVKVKLLGVSSEVLEEQTAVSEEVAREMVLGTLNAIGVDFAIASPGYAGPGGGTKAAPVGTIWLAYGNREEVRTFKLTEDFGRDINLAIATNKAIRMMLDFRKDMDIKSE